MAGSRFDVRIGWEPAAAGVRTPRRPAHAARQRAPHTCVPTARRAAVLHALLSVARWQHGWLNRMRTCALARSGARSGVGQMGTQQGAAGVCWLGLGLRARQRRAGGGRTGGAGRVGGRGVRARRRVPRAAERPGCGRVPARGGAGRAAAAAGARPRSRRPACLKPLCGVCELPACGAAHAVAVPNCIV